MDNAQVTVFSGAAPSVVYLSGMTDANGGFSFLPDRAESDDWDVQVRKAGHGSIAHLFLTGDSADTNRAGGLTVLQIVLMSLCVVWGFTGTALFFVSRRK